MDLKPDQNGADIPSQPNNGYEKNAMSMDDAPEHVKLAVDMIRQMENLNFPNETVLEACLLVIQDTLNKLESNDRLFWRNRLSSILSAPGSKKNFRQEA
ncbi:DUF2496 domain-containing protein [Parendozoicomonas sp. Alg238-R29]|uniref:DUF2496 domain-containing protein n=1 Tax=Parendozoicomonas sp. Alg238-R29 TaxID=2993446 RepID=UPI00248E8BE9|nr:DUF2496 domain-containing protein [Parendozoicomonas sp. Alg238-R29]